MEPNFNSIFRCLLLGLLLSGSQWAFAQATVSGTLTDAESGDPLIGASILAVGTGTGTITDFDGNYSLNVPNGVTQLQFSYTGYPTVVEDINGRTVITLALAPGELLDEVVVVGYGAVKKSDLTGSVNTVSEEDFNQGAIVNPTNLVSGKIAGVQVSSGDGQPGGGTNIRIRGGTSVSASNEPLYVVDGVPLANEGGGVAGGRGGLNFLNPNDIASMTILKDASAAAIYGSRGANGVVLITTKQGTAGAPRINYDASFNVSEAIGDALVLDADAFRNTVAFAAPTRVATLGNASTDWYDQSLQTAYGTQHNLGIGGGGESSTYRVSVGYQQLEGVVRGSETERISVGLNFTQNLFNDNLKIKSSIKGASTNNLFDIGPLGAARRFDPTQPVRDPDNTKFGGYFEYDQTLAPRNPISGIEQNISNGQTYRGLGNIDLTYSFDDLIPGLSYTAIGGFDVVDGQKAYFAPTTYATVSTSGFDGELSQETQRRLSKLFDTWFQYERQFGTQRASLQLGYSYQDRNNQGNLIVGRNLSTDAFGPNEVDVASEQIITNYILEDRLISFFGRLNYNIDEKYLLTASLRRDGSSRFGPENQFGTFPSVAVAWRFLEEDFAAGLANTFSDLKFRFGWGIVGNQEIGDYRFLPTYQFSDQMTQAQFGDRFVPTLRANAYDAGLKWEETTSLNFGIDFGFFNNRLSGIFEVYQKTTDDLLFTVNVPAGTNLSDRVLTNIGEIENQGVELTLNGIVYDKEDFGLSLSGNVAYNKNEITRLDGSGSADIQTGGIAGGVGNTVQLLRVGAPVNSFYLYEQRYGDDGRPVNDMGDNTPLDMYVDQNGDGLINEQDRRIIEKPAGDILFGLSANGNYKQFTFGMTFRGSVNNYVYNNDASAAGFLGSIDLAPNSLNNIHPSAVYTRFQDAQFFSDYYLEDASYIRLDNINLGYDFGSFLNDAVRLNVYATAQNLFTLTNYSGLDPETSISGDTPGIDNNRFPRSRTYTIGVRLGL